MVAIVLLEEHLCALRWRPLPGRLLAVRLVVGRLLVQAVGLSAMTSPGAAARAADATAAPVHALSEMAMDRIWLL